MTEIRAAFEEAQAEHDAEHLTAAQTAIDGLLVRYTELHGITGAGSSAPRDSTGIRGSRGLDLPAPVRVDVVDCIALIETVTRDMVTISRVALRLKREDRTGTGSTTRAQVTAARLVDLRERLPEVWRRSRSTALDVARRTWDLHEQAGDLLDLSPYAYRLGGSVCPACGLGETLWTFPERWQVKCGNPSCVYDAPVAVPDVVSGELPGAGDAGLEFDLEVPVVQPSLGSAEVAVSESTPG